MNDVFARWAAVSLGCFALNLATGIDSPWFLFPAAGCEERP